MPHILVAGKLHPAGLDLLAGARQQGFTHDYVEEVSEPSYAGLIGGADALVIRTQPLSAATIARGERLRVVSRHGVGYDAVDLAALNARQIALTIIGDVNSVSVAEHAIMLMLAAAKRVNRADRAVREPGQWGWRNLLEAREISGKRLLILGYGRAGRKLARMAAGFEMDVRAHDPWLERIGWPAGDVHPTTDLQAALGWADFVSVHVPRGDRPALGPAELAAMKPGAVLVNTARGGVVDETALALALHDGRIGAAGLDVFEDEPPSPDAHLLALDQVVLSPHIAGLTLDCAERMAVASVQNVLDFFAGSLDRSLIVNADTLHPQDATPRR
ncbi:MAG: hydroxyacid dehydrogenase [Paracoccaceae bacterium]|jgi:D-3-phosphoglycerate dehydrogenase